MTNFGQYNENIFESIKHVNEYGQEYWYARELQSVLEYTEWRNFQKLIEKAQTACENSDVDVDECFVEVNKTSPMPNGGVKLIEDYMNRMCYDRLYRPNIGRRFFTVNLHGISLSIFAPLRAAMLMQINFFSRLMIRLTSG